MQNAPPNPRRPMQPLKRLFFGVFILGASVVVFFLAFNYSVPFLKERVDHTVLDALSRIGALVYPFAVVLAGVGYAGIVLSSKRAKHGHCVGCGYDIRGLSESQCPECGLGVHQKKATPQEKIQGP